MENYLTQLLKDFRHAIENPPEVNKNYENPNNIPPELEYILEWEQAPQKPLSEWFGISKEVLPPVEKWSKQQLS